MDFSTMFSMLGQGFLVTLQIFFFTLVGALPLGVLVALGRMSKVKVISAIFRVYISIMRGTPLMLQLMFIYFAPYYIFGIKLSTEWSMGACLVAFILNYAAYFAEIYRSGIQSIPTGQYEAAEVLGYSRAQTFFKIIFPQVFKRIIPALGKGHLACFYAWYYGTLYHCSRNCVCARCAHGIHCCGGVLLGIHVLCGIYYRSRRKAFELLPRLRRSA